MVMCMFYWVLLGFYGVFRGFPRFHRPFFLNITSVLLCFIGFYGVCLGILGFSLVFSNFTWFDWAVFGVTGFYWA